MDPRLISPLAFRHLFGPIGERHHSGNCGRHVLGSHHRIFKVTIESIDVTLRQLQVLQLIRTYRHSAGPVQQDVGCHQYWVTVKTEAARGVSLLFVLNHNVEPVLRRHAAEYPAQLSMFGDVGLHKQHSLLGINAAGQHSFGHLQSVLSDGSLVLEVAVVVVEAGGECVVVDDTEEEFAMGLLEVDDAADGAEIVADMEVAGGLHAGEDGLFGDGEGSGSANRSG